MFSVAHKDFPLETLDHTLQSHRVEVIHLALNERGTDQNPYLVQILLRDPVSGSWRPHLDSCTFETVPDLHSALEVLNWFPGDLELIPESLLSPC